MRQVMRLLLANGNGFLALAGILRATLPGFAAGRFAPHYTALRLAPSPFLNTAETGTAPYFPANEVPARPQRAGVPTVLRRIGSHRRH